MSTMMWRFLPVKHTCLGENRSNGHLTESDFNRYYGVHLREGKRLLLSRGGMENTAPREVIICTNSGEEVASARYQSEPDKPMSPK
ncbi:hypothetical protein PO124_33895 [Bacillus licheniformis]|nr:hypothetical protein [Bacillus licheniformis]